MAQIQDQMLETATNAVARHQIAKAAALKVYAKAMEKEMQSQKALEGEKLLELSRQWEEAAVKEFDETKKLGGTELTDKYRGELCQEIQQIYEGLVKTNNVKTTINKVEEMERQWKGESDQEQIYNGFVEKDEEKANAEEKERQWKEKTAKMEKDNEANRKKMAKMAEELNELIKDIEANREKIAEIKEQFEVMTQSSLRNQMLPIVESDGKHGYRLNKEHLKEILHDPRVKNKMVAVLSVAEEYGMGQSFLVNFILRYLISKDKANWLNLNVALDKLFNYRAGSKTDSKGILAWSEPIMMVDTKSGKELAVILMDTQVSFDNQSSIKETATIFALSLMVSSTLIYNISKQLNSNHLENLQYFAKYAELAMDIGNGADEKMPPFQSLLFLIRDWQHSEDYGFEGGQQSLDKHLTPKESDTPKMRKLRADIRDKLFHSVRCFLMPEPGKKIKATAFDGDLRVIDEDFLEQMGMLVPGIFANLCAKSINGQALTGQELYQYFNAFKSGEMPDVKNVFEATAEANLQIAKAVAFKVYTDEMEKEMQSEKALERAKLSELSRQWEEAAVKKFNKAKKLGDAKLTDKYREGLRQEIQQIYIGLVEKNDWKAEKERLDRELEIALQNANQARMEAIVRVIEAIAIGAGIGMAAQILMGFF